VSFTDIKDDAIDGDLRERIESNKQELDRFLGVYPYDRLACCQLIIHCS